MAAKVRNLFLNCSISLHLFIYIKANDERSKRKSDARIGFALQGGIRPKVKAGEDTLIPGMPLTAINADSMIFRSPRTTRCGSVRVVLDVISLFVSCL